MIREIVKITIRAIIIPFLLATLIPHFLQLMLMWVESPFRLPGHSKQEPGQSQHPTPAEPAGGKIKPLLEENHQTLSASWRKCTGDFCMSAGAQMLGHTTRDACQIQPVTSQYFHKLVLSWGSESTLFEKEFIKCKGMALNCSWEIPLPHTISKGPELLKRSHVQIPVVTLICRWQATFQLHSW